jgi:CRP-like cAMP-binding protein
VSFHAHLRHPPELVMQLVTEALGSGGIPNVSGRTPPDCILMGFEDSWARYAVRYRLVDIRPDDPTDSAVRTRIWYILSRNEIEMPYPAHHVFLTERDPSLKARHAERERARRQAAIARVGLFSPLAPAERQHLADGLKHQIYGPGETILRMGDPGDSLFILHAGQVAVKIAGDGLEKQVASLHAGEFFGEMSLMTGEPRSATVVAAEKAECYVVERAAFQGVLASSPQLVTVIGRLLHERAVELAGRRADLDAATRERLHHEDALLQRIKSFFGMEA